LILFLYYSLLIIHSSLFTNLYLIFCYYCQSAPSLLTPFDIN